MEGSVSLDYKEAVDGLEKVQDAAKKTSETLEDTDEAAKNTGDSVKKSGEEAEKSGGGFTVWKGVLSNLVTGAITSLISGCAQLAGKIVELTQTAVGNYAEYEQLVGGVETLFKDSSDTLMEYAENAYKTAGLSANQYMETATSFAASLIQGVGGDTQKAVELVNTAVTDMADNANKMGTDIGSIQYAYQGFARQNYTMLDNLKLGYGGTQEEMVRLINDSGILNQTISDLDGITFDQVIQAIHEVQTQLGITGTTALEAGTTISGSWSSIQAMFDNILTKVGSQLAPVIMNFLSQLSGWLETVDWDAFAASIGDAFSGILSWLETVDFTALFEGIVGGITTIIEVVSWIIQNSDLVISVIGAIAAAVGVLNIVLNANPLGAIIAIITAIISLIVLLISNIDEISAAVQAAWDFVVGVISGVANWIYTNVIAPVVNFFQGLWQTVSGFFVNLWNDITGIFIQAALWWNENVVMPIVNFFQGLWETVSGFFVNLWNDITGIFINAALWWNENVVMPIINFFQGLWQTISGFFVNLWNDIVGVFTGAANWYNENVVVPIVNFFRGLWESVSGFFSNLWNDIVGIFTGIADWFYNNIIAPVVNVFQGLWNSITGIFDGIKNTITGVWNSIWDVIKSVINSIIGGVEGMVNGVISGINFILGGISDIANAVGGLIGLDPVNLRLNPVSLPRLAEGGVLERGQVGLLEGSGAEAVVPLEQNTGWIRRVAEQLNRYGSRDSQSQPQPQQAPSFPSPDQTEVTRRLDGLEGQVTAILNLLQTFFPQLLDALDVTLVLNDGTLVAKLAPKLDKRLAVLAKRKGAAYG